MDDRTLHSAEHPTESPAQLNQTNGLDEESLSRFFSDFTRYIFDIVVWAVLCFFVSTGGIAANVINLIVFFRQGITTESVTASLAGLAMAVLCCCITIFFHSINFHIILSPPPGIPYDPLSIVYVVTGRPHVMFTRVTCWITAYVALERSMCVLLPFKVKQIFTAPRSMTVICCIFVVVIASYIPMFSTKRLLNIRDPATNVSLVRLVYTSNYDEVEFISRHINDIILPSISMTIVIICTQLTITRLNASKRWRRKNARSGKSSEATIDNENQTNDNISTADRRGDSNQVKQITVTSNKPSATGQAITSAKETKVVKMITLICTIFIICNLPCVIIFHVRIVIPGIVNRGRYHNTFHILYALDFLIETINSSVNIFVYYNMSTRYKQEFRQLFWYCRK